MPFKSKDGSLYVCGNCKHRCVWYSDVGLCCEYNEDPVIKTDNNVHRLITLLDEDRTLIGHQETSWTYEKIFECFTFMDGKPFGVRY